MGKGPKSRWQDDTRFCDWLCTKAGGRGYIKRKPEKPGKKQEYDLQGLGAGLILYMYEAWRGGAADMCLQIIEEPSRPPGAASCAQSQFRQADRPGRPKRSSTSTDGPTLDEYQLLYDLDPGFGPWIRTLRDEANLSLRGVARDLGVSHTYLQRLETGGRARKPSLPQLHKVATVFGIPADEVERRAGVRRERIADPNELIHEQFRVLFLHPNWRAAGMTEQWLESFSVLQKRQLVQTLRQAVEQVKTGSRPPDDGSEDPPSTRQRRLFQEPVGSVRNGFQDPVVLDPTRDRDHARLLFGAHADDDGSHTP